MSKNIIVFYLEYIFNKCIEGGVFPTSFKTTEVVPIYKSGTKTECKNYRPISLLSPFAKLFESHLYTELDKYFTENNTIYKRQYGFQKNFSTEIALSSYCDLIAKEMDNNKITCSVFLDLAKAFNTVDPDIPISKLHTYGIRELSLDLITSYLKDRQQFTRTKNTKSTSRSIRLGVHQGSSLGPLFFIIYINDLPLSTNLDVRLYADDASLTFSHQNHLALQTTMNSELSKVSEWLYYKLLLIISYI